MNKIETSVILHISIKADAQLHTELLLQLPLSVAYIWLGNACIMSSANFSFASQFLAHVCEPSENFDRVQNGRHGKNK